MTEEETIPSMMPSMAPAEEEGEETNPMTPEEVACLLYTSPSPRDRG